MVTPVMLIRTIYIESGLIVGACIKYTQSFDAEMTEWWMRVRVMVL